MSKKTNKLMDEAKEASAMSKDAVQDVETEGVEVAPENENITESPANPYPSNVFLQLSDDDRRMLTLERVKNIEVEMWKSHLSMAEMQNVPYHDVQEHYVRTLTELENLNQRRTNILGVYNDLQGDTEPSSAD